MDKMWLKEYQEGVPAEIEPDLYPSLIELYLETCSKFSERPAVSNLNYQLTFQRLAELSSAFAAFLQQKLGLKKGDRFAIMLPNILQYPVVLFGALQAGLTIVNTNPFYTVTELVQQMNNSEAESIIVLANFAHVVQAALPQTKLKNVIVTEVADILPWYKSWVINAVVKFVKKMVPKWSIPNAFCLKKILKEGASLRFNKVVLSGSDIAFLQYTGGTTGISKGAILTHRNIIANILQVNAWIKPVLEPGKEIFVVAIPLYHVFSLTMTLTLLCFGAMALLITDPRNIPRFVAELKKTPFTILGGVNTLFNALLRNSEFTKMHFDHLKVAIGGGAAIQKAVALNWKSVTHKVLFEGYGLTEASPVVSIQPFSLSDNNDSIGLPLPSTEIMICDEEGKEVPLGKRGELCVKGPQVMQGYWRNPAETEKVLTKEGWLQTGDIALMDEKGYLYLVDRKKDIILVSGFNVYPNELEEVLALHPGVQTAAVIGIPDAITGEAVKAFIVKKDPSLTKEALRKYCRGYLTGYKVPKTFEFRDSLPMSPVGKVLRRALRE